MASNHICQNSRSLETQQCVALETEFLMQKLGPRERQPINSVLNRANLREGKENINGKLSDLSQTLWIYFSPSVFKQRISFSSFLQ